MDQKQNQVSPIQQLINSIDIVSVVKNYINLQKKGQNYWGLCPFHGDKNPSLSVNSEKRIFKCFVCGVTGNAIKFVQEYKKINFYQAIKEVIKLTNYDSPTFNKFLDTKIDSKEYKAYDLNNQAAFIYHRTLYNNANADKLEYLLSRNLTKELINEYMIGFAPNQEDKKYLFSILTNENNIMGENRDQSLVWSPIELVNNGLVSMNDDNQYFDFFWNRIIIPIKDEYGNIVGFSGRTLNPNEKIKYINTKTTEVFKKENILFNFYNFDKSIAKEIFVVEGYMDVFAFKRMGINNVVASMGTSFTLNQINLIKKYKNIESLILCFDNDHAGFNATIELAEKLMNQNIKVFVVNPYDSKHKDVDELLKGVGETETIKLVHKQISFINYVCIKTFENKQLSQKEIAVETKKIADLINKFAYDEFTIDFDLNILSQYSKISVENLKKYINVAKQQNNVVSNPNSNSYNNDFKNNNQYKPKEINYDFYFPKVNKNVKPLHTILDDNDIIKKKETELFKIICSNDFIAKLFIKYLKKEYFQTNQTIKKIFNQLVWYIQVAIENENNISPTNLLKIIELEKEEYKKDLQYLVSYLKQIETTNNKNDYSEYQLEYQGISLMIDIIVAKQKLIEAEIILENSKDASEQLKKSYIEYNKTIKSLMDIKERILGK